jgi:predicted RNase H-like HicB family nuclease
VAEKVKHYVVDYERDEGEWWVASVRSVAGCHTQGRTIREARRRIRQALGLFVDDADSATLEDHVHLPERYRRALARYESIRRRAQAEQARSQDATAQAVTALTSGMHLSTRDVGDLMGLSHQRVHQLAEK